MILDERNEFADAVSVAASAGTTVLGDVIDLGATTQDVGNGEPVYLVINTDTAIVTGGSAGTIQFSVVSDSLSTLGSATVANCTLHAQTAAFVTGASATGAIAAGGNILVMALPIASYERYLGVLVTVGTTTTTAGKVNAFLTQDVAKWVATANAI